MRGSAPASSEPASRVCRRLGLSAPLTDAATTLTALHLKIGFMQYESTDYPPVRLASAAGPFGVELAVLSWADRLAARGRRLKSHHVERHAKLCAEFLSVSRGLGPYPEPDYAGLSERIASGEDLAPADVGYAASRLRLLVARGTDERTAAALSLRS